ncbi:MAG: single-stranded DNA-binding protein [Treponema sp.]|nr:single-stranded DNA-binding protein [Treponema sp.]
MADLNHVVLIGRLTREAELKYTASGQAVCKFSIAVNRRKKNGDQWEDEANFFDIVVWGRQGESLHPYLVKGKMVGVDGELRQDRWQQDGQNRSKIEIIANYLQLLGGGSGSGAGSGSGERNERQNYQNNSSNSDNSQSYSSSKDENFVDDIPF